MKITISPKPKHYKKKSTSKDIIHYKGRGEFCKHFFKIFHFFAFFPQITAYLAVFRLKSPQFSPNISFFQRFLPFERQKAPKILCSSAKMGLKYFFEPKTREKSC